MPNSYRDRAETSLALATSAEQRRRACKRRAHRAREDLPTTLALIVSGRWADPKRTRGFPRGPQPCFMRPVKMNVLDQALEREIAALRDAGLYRELRRIDSPQASHLTTGGRAMLNFSSNNYLGLANHPALREAAARALQDFGAGCGASRLICGSLAPHHELEVALAEFKGTEAALSFSSGHAAALGTIPALVGRGDVVIIDKLVHACLVDAARLSGAKLRVFAHNDLADLEHKLKWAQRVQSSKCPSRVLVVTESVFSMEGDAAPLQDLVSLKDRFGAWLMLDEAHATGLYGERRRGLAEACGLSDRVEVHMGTLGKALGASGGYIVGSRILIDFLINTARSFIFSTAPVPAAAAAATAAVRLVQASEGDVRCRQLWDRAAYARSRLAQSAWSLPEEPSAIIPLVLGAEAKALAAAAHLRERGIYIAAIRYPTVARGKARLRVTLTADHTEADVEEMVKELEEVRVGGGVKRRT